MSYEVLILIFLFTIGFLLIAVGIVLKVHSHKFRYQNNKDGITLEGMAQRKTLSPFLSLLSGNIRSRRYKFSQKVISRSETEMTVQALYLLKLISVIAFTVISLYYFQGVKAVSERCQVLYS